MTFAAAPGTLPGTVQAALVRAIENVPEVGLPLLHISHRTDWFARLIVEVEGRMKRLLAIPDNYRVLFLQGGATAQFSLAPMNLGAMAIDIVSSGYWSRRAINEMRHVCSPNIVWEGDGTRLPEPDELPTVGHGVLHYISSETVEGLQYDYIPEYRGDLVCDMSSDILSRPVDFGRYAIAYAHAQKQMGPPGLTVVIVRDDVIERSRSSPLPPLMTYAAQADKNSIYNTPPCFQIYLLGLLFDWLEHEIGGVEQMARINALKAEAIWSQVDAHPDLFQAPVHRRWRSRANVAFQMDASLRERFLADATAAGFVGLEGHRSCGGCRISLYNTISLEQTRTLAQWMGDWAARADPARRTSAAVQG